MSDKVENPFWGRNKKGGSNLAPANVIQKAMSENVSKDQLTFPEDIGQHRFLMLFQKYNFEQNHVNLTDSITLPMPQSIVDKYGMEYNQTDLKTAGAGAASAFRTAMNNIGNEGKEAAMDLTNAEYQETADALLRSVEGVTRDMNPIESLRGAVDLARGNIVNPHTALLFNAVKLKEFEFAWKLYPRSANESGILRQIIKKIKMRSHPSYKEHGVNDKSVSNFLLDYPHEVDLFYLGPENEMHKFKRCAITSVSINYTPEGGPQFIAGSGEPAFVEVQLGFTETQIWTSEDFDSSDYIGKEQDNMQGVVEVESNGRGYGRGGAM